MWLLLLTGINIWEILVTSFEPSVTDMDKTLILIHAILDSKYIYYTIQDIESMSLVSL